MDRDPTIQQRGGVSIETWKVDEFKTGIIFSRD